MPDRNLWLAGCVALCVASIAATYLVFGSFSCVALGVSPPMASFVVCALLAGLPTIGPRRS